MLIENSLNIGGSEWIIIIFAVLILILGTNKLPEVARKLGKATYEYNKAKNEVANQMKDFSNHTVEVNGPVQNERQKLESIAKSLGINPIGLSTEQLQQTITNKIGTKKDNDKS